MTKDKKDNDKEKENSKNDQPAEGEPLIPISMSEYDEMQKQISSLKSQADEYLDGMQRERANFANYKKRMDLESINSYNNVVADVAKNFLVVIDDIDRALKNKPTGKSTSAWVDGIELIRQKLLRTLENQGVERFEAKPGDQFDPNFFEAVTHEDHEQFTDGQVIEVLQPGYKIKERIIRPALVRVAK